MKTKQQSDAADSKAGSTLVDRSDGARSDLLDGAPVDRSTGGLAGEAADQSQELRMTRQRRVILDEFRTAGLHHTADEVYLSVRRTLPNISLGTVYRNLDVLSQAGLIRTLNLGAGQRLYDGGLHPHYHVRCRQCGKVSDVAADSFDDLEAAARDACDFEILSHELGFEGLCSDCGAAVSAAAAIILEQTDRTGRANMGPATRERGTSVGQAPSSQDRFSQDAIWEQRKGVGS